MLCALLRTAASSDKTCWAACKRRANMLSHSRRDSVLGRLRASRCEWPSFNNCADRCSLAIEQAKVADEYWVCSSAGRARPACSRPSCVRVSARVCTARAVSRWAQCRAARAREARTEGSERRSESRGGQARGLAMGALDSARPPGGTAQRCHIHLPSPRCQHDNGKC